MKIGETFSYNGKTYVAEPATKYCKGCAFNADGLTIPNVCKADCINVPLCVPHGDNGDDIIFKEVTQ